MSKGILVIDKIPEYCDEHCKFCDSFFNCQYVGDVEEAWRNKQRDSKCPIKPLPEMHGKIGDIDRLYEVFKKNVAGASAFKELFDIAPTIIEADKGETDNE